MPGVGILWDNYHIPFDIMSTQILRIASVGLGIVLPCARTTFLKTKRKKRNTEKILSAKSQLYSIGIKSVALEEILFSKKCLIT